MTGDMVKLRDRDPGQARILLLTADDFGRAVGDRLRDLPAATVLEIDKGTHPSQWPYADLIVLATGHERPQLAEALDRAAFAWRIPWFPIYTTSTTVQCGPVVVPGATACLQCFVRRRAQHAGQSRANARYETDVAFSHPPHHVGIAAGLARQAVREALGSPPVNSVGGTVRTFDQVNGSISKAAVVAVDRCPRCRAGNAESRSDELWRLLASSLPEHHSYAEVQR
jgi:bacteriocin biosynthesis cyclodehydratase domain-containing protein